MDGKKLRWGRGGNNVGGHDEGKNEVKRRCGGDGGGLWGKKKRKVGEKKKNLFIRPPVSAGLWTLAARLHTVLVRL